VFSYAVANLKDQKRSEAATLLNQPVDEGTVDMHSLDRVNMAWDRQHPCNIGPGVIGACPRFA